ncbi:MAG: EF-P lysine aminoacylase EpmA [Pseudomonadota bacterium]|nr:EF-P lysine aminoacylase EpmA [Pseudomonadota bacterium]
MTREVRNWRPSASLETIKERAALNSAVRSFFASRNVLEVETPILSQAATVDKHIDSFATAGVGDGKRWLHTSPEFAMKRLLAADSGPIYQIARVFRRDEQGRHHNPEFTMLEWYRPGFDHHALMDELAELLAACGVQGEVTRLSYREAFEQYAGFDPHALDAAELRERWTARDMVGIEGLSAAELGDADFWLDLLMSHVVGPQLGRDAPQFVYDFPATQAALSRVRSGTPPLAERFELFWRGIELANGFHELTDAAEQQRRFEADQQARTTLGRGVPPCDAHLIDALTHGMPPCAGVAVGLDRVLMLKLGLSSLEQVLAFAADRA